MTPVIVLVLPVLSVIDVARYPDAVACSLCPLQTAPLDCDRVVAVRPLAVPVRLN